MRMVNGKEKLFDLIFKLYQIDFAQFLKTLLV